MKVGLDCRAHSRPAGAPQETGRLPWRCQPRGCRGPRLPVRFPVRPDHCSSAARAPARPVSTVYIHVESSPSPAGPPLPPGPAQQPPPPLGLVLKDSPFASPGLTAVAADRRHDPPAVAVPSASLDPSRHTVKSQAWTTRCNPSLPLPGILPPSPVGAGVAREVALWDLPPQPETSLPRFTTTGKRLDMPPWTAPQPRDPPLPRALVPASRARLLFGDALGVATRSHPGYHGDDGASLAMANFLETVAPCPSDTALEWHVTSHEPLGDLLARSAAAPPSSKDASRGPVRDSPGLGSRLQLPSRCFDRIEP